MYIGNKVLIWAISSGVYNTNFELWDSRLYGGWRYAGVGDTTGVYYGRKSIFWKKVALCEGGGLTRGGTSGEHCIYKKKMDKDWVTLNLAWNYR